MNLVCKNICHYITYIFEAFSNMESENIIQLGDIVKIVSSESHKLHDSSFYVAYIDPKMTIELIHIGSMQVHVLPIVKGKLLDDEIKQIHIINRSIHKGYSRQNGLFPGTWITIDFGGEIPAIVTAQITHLEEDMISLMTYPENEILYIDFEYKGIPKHIPLQRICIRDKPSSYDSNMSQNAEELLEEGAEELSMNYQDNGDILVSVPENIKVDENYQDILSELLIPSNALEENEMPEYQVDRPSQFTKYKLETQINHLLDDLLATVSDTNRKDRVLRKIYTHIQRFQELRELYSTYDEFQQVSGFIRKNPMVDKPLVDALLKMNKTIPWLKPVVSQYRRIYDVNRNQNTFDSFVIGTLQTLEIENEFESDFMRLNYNNNENVKYQGLYQEWGNMTRPFSYDWSTQDTLLKNIEVNCDMDLIVSNNGNFKSSVVDWKEKTTQNYLFHHNRYVSSIDFPLYDPRKRETKLGTLMEADRAAVNSLLYMPSSVIDYTKLYLPGSSILQKSNKHMNLLYPFTLLTNKMKKSMNIQEVVVKSDKPDSNDQLIPLEKNLRHVKLEPYQEILEDKSDMEKYKLFLQHSIPNIFTIIHEFVKKNEHIYNLSQYMDQLEPFYIYHKDVSFKAGETIKFNIRDNIQEYVNRYQSKLQDYNRLKLLNFKQKIVKVSEIYNKIGMNLLVGHFDYLHTLFTNYLIDETSMNNNEILHNMYLKDDASLFDKIIQITNLDLVSPTEILPEDFDEDEEFVPITKGMCLRKNLSKRYSSIKDLQNDNDARELEYDDEFDDTNYDVMKQYKHEKEAMDSEVFVDFLAEKLILNHKCPRSMSENMAQTLIRGKKLVQDGDYAILELRPQYVDGDISALSEEEKKEIDLESDVRRTVNYYRRMKHVWIYDKDIDENAFIDSNTLLCNIKESCYKHNDTCESVVNDTRPRMRKQSKQEIINEFSERYTEEIERKKKRLETHIRTLQTNLERRLTSETFIRIIFDLKAFALGQTTVFLESNESPYQYLHDLVVQPNFDFYKKQEYIIKIVHNYCRDPLPSENPHWKYCLKTNAKLMENSLYLLAIAFQNNEYNKVLQHLCRNVGKEDGEFVYDKETGCILKNIEYQEDANQDYNRGRDVDEDYLEAALDDLAIDENNQMEIDASQKQKKIYHYDEETQHFYNLLQAICKKSEGVDIEVETIQETVLQLCTSLLTEKKIFLSESRYEKEREKAQKKKINLPPYKKFIATKKLELLVCSTIIAVQCLIPSVKRRKTFPGCVQSFYGYPLQPGMDDMSTVEYFACVLRKKSKESDTSPWNTVPKKANVMEEKLKDMLEKFVVPHSYAQNILDKKRIYDREHANDVQIPESLDVAKNWFRFTPIIVPFSVTNGKTPLRNVSEGFQNELMATLKQGKKAQWDHIGVLNHKIDLFSAAVIESVKLYVKQQDALLMTQSKIPFLQNACCVNGKTFETPLQYFINEDDSIKRYVKQCIVNSLAVRDIQLLSKAYFFQQTPQKESIDTHRKLAKQNAFKTYNTNILYQAFIQYCYLDNETIPIPTELQVICAEKPENYNKDASIEEKIDFLKNNSQRLSETKFIEMMKLINKRNCVQVKLHDVNFKAEMNRSLTTIQTQIEEYKKLPESLKKFVDIFWKFFDHEKEDLDTLEKEEYVFASCMEDDETSGKDQSTSPSASPSGEADTRTPSQKKMDDFVNFVTPEIQKLKQSLEVFLKEQKLNGLSETKLRNIFHKLFPDELTTDYVSYCTFMKNYLYALCVEYPLRVTNYYSRNHEDATHSSYNIPKHWVITPTDQLNLVKYIGEINQSLDTFYQDPQLIPLMNHAKLLLSEISSILKFFYSFFPEQNTKLYIRLFQYLCLMVFHLHIELATEEIIANETFQLVRQEENDNADELIEVRNFVPVDDVTASIHKRLGELFEIYLNTVLSRKQEYTVMTYKDITKLIERSVEEEKHSIKEHFRKMSKEERRAEMLMKSLHLGIFNVNNKKLISYGNDQTDLFGAVVSEQQMDILEDQVMERILNPDQMDGEGYVEMPEENDPDAEGFHEDPDEDMYDMLENAYEQNT